jgi:hypothetical protein
MTMSELESTPRSDAGNVCANCASPLVGRFCHECGQEASRSRRLDLRQVSHDFMERLLNLDSSLVRTFIGLTTRPGSVCREYIHGQRVRYTSPIAYLAISCVANAVLYSLARFATSAAMDPIDAFTEDWAMPILVTISLPAAMAFWKLFPERNYNFAENLVFTLYVVAHIGWLEAILVGPVAPFPRLADVATSVVLFIALGYTTFAGMHFYQVTFGRCLLRVLLVGLVCMAVLIVILLILFPAALSTE